MNNVDILILSFLCSLSLGIVRLLYLSHGSTFKRLSTISVLLLSIPHIALMFYTCFKLAEKTGITQFLKIKYTDFKACILTTRRTSQAQVNAVSSSTLDTDPMPDRLIIPGEYEPLLPNMEVHIARCQLLKSQKY